MKPDIAARALITERRDATKGRQQRQRECNEGQVHRGRVS